MNIEIKSLWKKSASEIIKLLSKKEVSPLEVINSSIIRIDEVNNKINAVITLTKERAKDNLVKKENTNANRKLKSMPVLIKDINDVKDVRTTYGSRLYSDNIPNKSDIMVDTLEKNGGVILGKTNVPEFAAGSHTYNELFGLTKNPWNINLSAGGSSGGSAAALASGMAWFATGTDLGGSLRNPASWCGVVGLRPTPGLIPHGPAKYPFFNLSVAGPMARNVEDLSILLDAMVGFNIKDPLSFKKERYSYHDSLLIRRDEKYLIGFTEDFDLFPCDMEVRNMMKNTVKLIQSLGHTVSNDFPDMKRSEFCFQTMRAYMFYCSYKFLLEMDQSLIKEEVIWNIKKGKDLSIEDLQIAEEIRSKIYQNTLQFFEKFDFLILPSSVVPPFDARDNWVKKVEDTIFDNYVSWLMIAASISLTGCPSLAIPTSFSRENAPYGVQIVAAPNNEQKLINFAKALEDNINISEMIPININNENF